eukprot:TRINITY_DN3974_c0_g1_i1.p1 TRINITY_DN3974_c0_g1~~TRINITY_DN3974_c0_g1_i1.p1  ORF type:complete len:331 (-),score=81.95 TRINITY_DN3974_c0_g1_i1:50-1042(-)
MTSLLLPTFIKKLQGESIENILICGCGGGFDFIHSLLIYPELKQMGKRVIFGSYSFGDIRHISGEYESMWNTGEHNEVKRVTGDTTGNDYYAPEILLARYLDSVEPEEVHFVYAYYARAFTVPQLKEVYQNLVDLHEIDAVVILDGGTDSLMAGDEPGLGDPIEDCVSVTACSLLEGVKEKILITVGFGADRFNGVLDTSSLRAAAELTAVGGSLGTVAIEKNSALHEFYRNGVEFIYENQSFRSVLTGLILESIEGNYGHVVPRGLERRVREGDAYCWPLMSFLWAYDIDAVVKRSYLSKLIKNCTTIDEMYTKMNYWRKMTELREDSI